MRLTRHLLWIDGIAAALAGTLVLSLTEAIARLYAMPTDRLRVIGMVNLLYACLSGSLAMRGRRPVQWIAALSIANGLWATACIGMAVAMAGTATLFGMAHLLGEVLFVGGLAVLEWRWRDRLAADWRLSVEGDHRRARCAVPIGGRERFASFAPEDQRIR